MELVCDELKDVCTYLNGDEGTFARATSRATAKTSCMHAAYGWTGKVVTETRTTQASMVRSPVVLRRTVGGMMASA